MFNSQGELSPPTKDTSSSEEEEEMKLRLRKWREEMQSYLKSQPNFFSYVFILTVLLLALLLAYSYKMYGPSFLKSVL
jgi:hypothetical protein